MATPITSTQITKAQVDAWIDHPLVAETIEKVGGLDDPLLVLEKLSETLNDLEERFPGMSFEQMLRPARRYDKGAMRKALVREGYSDDQARDILGLKKQ